MMSYVLKSIKFVILVFCFIIPIGSLKVYANSPVYNSSKSTTEKIAITFDDGPHPVRTIKLLNVLKKHDIKATFFVIGQNVDNYPDALREIINDGHEIANHTYSHKILKNVDYNYVLNEIKDTEEAVSKNGGVITKIIRPPCGIFDSSLLNLACEDDYKIVLWNIDTHDWANESADNISKNIIKNVSGGDIILFHDYTSGENHTDEALERIIPMLKEKGYEFVTVSQLLQE